MSNLVENDYINLGEVSSDMVFVDLSRAENVTNDPPGDEHDKLSSQIDYVNDAHDKKIQGAVADIAYIMLAKHALPKTKNVLEGRSEKLYTKWWDDFLAHNEANKVVREENGATLKFCNADGFDANFDSLQVIPDYEIQPLSPFYPYVTLSIKTKHNPHLYYYKGKQMPDIRKYRVDCSVEIVVKSSIIMGDKSKVLRTFESEFENVLYTAADFIKNDTNGMLMLYPKDMTFF